MSTFKNGYTTEYIPPIGMNINAPKDDIKHNTTCKLNDIVVPEPHVENDCIIASDVFRKFADYAIDHPERFAPEETDNVVIDELVELVKALNLTRRRDRYDTITHRTEIDDNIIEEMADVIFVMERLRRARGVTIKQLEDAIMVKYKKTGGIS